MDEKTRKNYEQKTPREEKVMERAHEKEEGGFIEEVDAKQGRANRPEAERGGEPPRPVNPPHQPKGTQKSHG